MSAHERTRIEFAGDAGAAIERIRAFCARAEAAIADGRPCDAHPFMVDVGQVIEALAALRVMNSDVCQGCPDERVIDVDGETVRVRYARISDEDLRQIERERRGGKRRGPGW